MNLPGQKSSFVDANGIRLHYLDWGGSGPALIFLAGFGCNAYIFSEFAPRFTDHFHVLAMTRRGHGDSDHPESGYDIDTLTEDLLQFMNALGIEQAVLVGHSLAGIELTHFIGRHPGRVLKLVYLDAVFDYSSAEYKEMMAKNPLLKLEAPNANTVFYNPDDYEAAIQKDYPSLGAIWGAVMHEQFLHEIDTGPDGKVVDRLTDPISAAIRQTINTHTPREEKIPAPVLAFFVFTAAKYYTDETWMTAEQRANIAEYFATTRTEWLKSWIEQYQGLVPQARVVAIPEGHHYCFMADEETVYAEMRRFLVSS